MDIPVGIVLYNPEINRLEENINSIYERASSIIFNDNGSENIKEIERLLSKYKKAVLIKNGKNLGIASALNILCRQTEELGYKWILTLDQDSICPNNIFSDFSQYVNYENVGIICPVIRDRNCDFDKNSANSGITEIERCITSGTLLNVTAWEDVNGFDENMFIDGVDFDFCERIRIKGYKILRVQSVVLLHEIGHIKVRRFIFWRVRVKNHSAFRKYYIAKNTIYLARKSKSKARILKSYLQVAKQYATVLLYETDKKSKLHEIIRGFKAGKNENIDMKWSY